MKVYFARAVGGQLVKIGFSEDVARRMRNLALSFEDGIEVLATCDGGREVEAAYHRVLANWRHEGEWFHPNECLDAIVAELSKGVAPVVFPRRKRTEVEGESPIDADRRMAKAILGRLLSREPAGTTISMAIERAYETLVEINPLWTRRRVRSIWEAASRRIEFYEIRDLLEAIGHAGISDEISRVCEAEVRAAA